jgi:hypothetical protein
MINGSLTVARSGSNIAAIQHYVNGTVLCPKTNGVAAERFIALLMGRLNRNEYQKHKNNVSGE